MSELDELIGSELPQKSKFIDLLIENLEHGSRDEGIYFSDSLRYEKHSSDLIKEFEKKISDYKHQ